MKSRVLSQCMVIVLIIMTGCKKEDDPQPTTAVCRIQKEMTSDGNYSLYSYDNDGNPASIEHHDPYAITRVLNVYYDYIAVAEMNKLHPITLKTDYGVGFLDTLPDMGVISVTMDGVTQVNWKTYFFHYDSEGRLIQVVEETKNIQGDDQWELSITYDHQDNVTKLSYTLTTGARNLSTVIVADGYDDQHTPYAGVKAYKFLMSNWDNYDPGPILTALSKNNPTSYSLVINGNETMNVLMEYDYNEYGFPIARTEIHTNDAGKTTDRRTFEYSCRK